MQIVPYLHFPGTCKEAFAFYHQVLGGEIEAMVGHAGTPAEEFVSPAWRDKIMHARLVTKGTTLMGSDGQEGHEVKPQGFSVSIQLDDPQEAEKIYHALVQGGTEVMPVQQTFWAERFGMLVDRFGIPWMINCFGNVTM